MINENDYGMYKCLAVNELGNATSSYRIQSIVYFWFNLLWSFS